MVVVLASLVMVMFIIHAKLCSKKCLLEVCFDGSICDMFLNGIVLRILILILLFSADVSQPRLTFTFFDFPYNVEMCSSMAICSGFWI